MRQSKNLQADFNMRVGILTQPLYCNYGGIVQCYALQTVLKRMGHDTVVLQREHNHSYTLQGAFIYYIKRIAKLMLGRKESWHYYVAQEKRDYIARNTYRFIEAHIHPCSNKCYTTEQLKNEVERFALDAIIVGSDQVWRPDFSPCQPNYFLDFLSADSPIKRISYAASFGGDRWDWNPALTKLCATLLQLFDAVSVREKSGIRLCKEHFNVDAVQVLDPTMLLNPDDYRKVVGKQRVARGTLFNYVLDRSDEKQYIIRTIENNTGKTSFCSMPALDDSVYNLYGDIDKSVYPQVEDWLSAFDEAEMVVTDSFHGTVFSIIFNKPFWVIGNEGRGMARFETLLGMYGLENRMINASAISNTNLDERIDWESVNAKRKELQKVSMDFICKSLS